MSRTFTDFLADLLAAVIKRTPEFNVQMALTEFFDKTPLYNDCRPGETEDHLVTDKSFTLKMLLYGSFSAPRAKEMLAFCSFDSTGHYAGEDRTVAVLMQAEGFAVLGYHDFYSMDHMQVYRLPTADGQHQLLTLTNWTLQGARDTTVTQWDLTGGRFAAQPPLVEMHNDRFPDLRYAFYDDCRLIFTDGVPENPPTAWASEIGPVRYNFKWDPAQRRFVSIPRYQP